jgi:hypothetical protein
VILGKSKFSGSKVGEKTLRFLLIGPKTIKDLAKTTARELFWARAFRLNRVASSTANWNHTQGKDFTT